MQFLERIEIEEWCSKHEVGAKGFTELNFAFTNTFLIEVDGKPTRAREGSETFVSAIGQFDQALVTITQWGVWPSSEDWPAYYTWRGSHNEKRSLERASGHLFTGSETEDFLRLLEFIGNCGWDAEVLCLIDERIDKFGGSFSHDGYFKISSAENIEISW